MRFIYVVKCIIVQQAGRLSMNDFLKYNASKYRDRCYLISVLSNRSYTYSDIYTMATGMANGLIESGVRRADRILAILPNSTEYVVSAFAALLCGATFVPINTHVDKAIVGQVRDKIRPKVAVATFDNEHIAIELGLPIYKVDEKSLWKQRSSQLTVQSSRISPLDTCVILFTSGTTGNPKGVMLSIKSVITNFTEYGHQMGFSKVTRFLQVMPVHHADGWNFTFLMPFLHGSSVVLSRAFDEQVCVAFEHMVRRYQPNVLIAMPSILQALTSFKSHYSNPTKLGLEYVISSSEDLSTEVKNEFEDVFRCIVYDLYGLTETGVISYYGPKVPWRAGSVGKLQKRVEAQILNGEIVIRSPYLFSEYCNDRRLTKDRLINSWFHTRDLGYIDTDGYVFLSGRLNG